MLISVPLRPQKVISVFISSRQSRVSLGMTPLFQESDAAAKRALQISRVWFSSIPPRPKLMTLNVQERKQADSQYTYIHSHNYSEL